MKTNYIKNFKAALKFVAKSETRPVLQGVYHSEDGRIVATDSHRVIIIENAHNGEYTGKTIDKDGQQMPGNYPNLDRFIPNYSQFETTININNWLDVHAKIKKDKCKTVRLISSEKSSVILQGINDPHLVDEYQLNDYLGFNLKIAYNVNYMIDALRALKSLGYKECSILFNDKNTAICMHGKTNSNITVITMILPVRLGREPKRLNNDEIISIGDTVEFKDKNNTCKAEVKKINNKYFVIVMNGQEYKVAKNICKKVMGAF